MMISVKTESVKNAASELSSCLKKLEFTRLELEDTYMKFKHESEQGMKFYEELMSLDKLRSRLDSNISTARYMADMLARAAFELESAEEDVLSYEVDRSKTEDSVEMNDLTDYINMLGEICEEV